MKNKRCVCFLETLDLIWWQENYKRLHTFIIHSIRDDAIPFL